jgi:hypothetical protein
MQGRLTALEHPLALESQIFEHIFHIEEGGPCHTGTIDSYVIPDRISSMPITAVCACNNFLLLAQQDGAKATALRQFSLPEMRQVDLLKVPSLVQRMWLNCNATRLALVDAQVGSCDGNCGKGLAAGLFMA